MPRKSVADIEDDIDRLLRKCRSLTADGVWRRMRFLIETKSDRAPYARCGGLPLSTPETLATAIKVSGVKVTRALAAMQIVGLIQESAEGYFSPKLQRILEVKAGDARRQRRYRDTHKRRRKTKNKGVTIKEGVMSHPEGVMSHGCHTLVTPAPSPSPPSLPPTPPIPIPPLSPSLSPLASQSVRAEAEIPKSAGKFPAGVWKRACDGWMKAYQHVHRRKYIGRSREWKALAEILTALNGDVLELGKVVRAWLIEPEIGWVKGHELHVLLENLNYIQNKIANGTTGDNGQARKSSPPPVRTVQVFGEV